MANIVDEGLLPLSSMQSKKAIGGLILVFAYLLTFSAPSVAQDQNQFAIVNMSLLRSLSGVDVVPVEVNVATQRALDATLVIDNDRNAVDWEFPLALAANTDVSQVILAPTSFNDLSLRATLIVEGETVAVAELRGFDVRPQANAVGLIELVAPAGSVPLTPAIGQAALIELDDLGILPGLDSVVTSPGGFRALTPDERRILLTWTAAGRQLLVAGDPGSIDDQLPAEWSSSGRTLLAGAGIIRYVGTDWSDNIAPGIRSTVDPNQLGNPNQGGFNVGIRSNQELLADAGISVPGLGSLSLVLVAYLLVAGPITFGVLRAIDRPTLAWVVLPALAVLFTGGVFVAGGFLTGGRGNGYATIVEVSPAGASATETILIANDGRQTVELPIGATLLSSTLGGDGGFGSPVVIQPTRTSTNLEFDIDPGSGGTAVLSLPSDFAADSMELTDVTVTGDSVSGRFVNASGSDLHNVVGLVGESIVGIGTVPNGESTEFTVTFADGRSRTPELGEWNVERWVDWRGPDRNDDEFTDGPINASAWVDWRARRIGTDAPRGMVTVVGWTRDAKSSLVGGKGRTALVVRRNFDGVRGAASPQVVRAMSATSASPFDDTGQGAPSIVTQFIRPANADTSELALEVPGVVREVELWTADGWRSLAIDEPDRQTVALIEEAWIDDAMWVRTNLGNFFGEGPFVQDARLVDGDDNTIVTTLLPAGERSQRESFGGEFGDFPGPIALGTSSPLVLDDAGAATVQGEIFNSFDEWTVDLQIDQTITVTLSSVEGTFDPNLVLRGPTGQVRAENDDFNGLNSRIEFTADEDGTYIVEARPLGTPGFGVYELGVQVEPFEAGVPAPEPSTTTEAAQS